MSRRYTDNALTTLASSITAGSTTLTVATGKGNNFPAVTGRGAPGSTPDFFVITMENSAGTREKIRVENRAAGSDVLGSAGFPLVRGFDGTTAAAWNAGDIVDLRPERVGVQGWEDDVAASALGRAFGYKDSTTAGLVFGFYGGLIYDDAGAFTPIADGTVALTASQTNFVERTTAGVVSANTVGFTVGRVRLYQVTTDATGITSILDKRATLMLATDGRYPGSLFFPLAGPHAIGGVLNADIQLYIKGAFTGGANVWGAYLDSSLTPAVNGLATGIYAQPTLNKAGSGTHADFSTMRLDAPIIGAGAAALTNASTLKITGAPSGGTNNRALWVESGLVEFGGGQIKFPATQNASSDANTLDDYEEGTWTPSVGGNATYVVNTGRYVKVGNLVFCSLTLAINVLGTGSTTQITGAPFNANIVTALAASNSVGAATNIVSMSASISGSTDIITIRSRTAASASDAANAYFANSTGINVAGCWNI